MARTLGCTLAELHDRISSQEITLQRAYDAHIASTERTELWQVAGWILWHLYLMAPIPDKEELTPEDFIPLTPAQLAERKRQREHPDPHLAQKVLSAFASIASAR